MNIITEAAEKQAAAAVVVAKFLLYTEVYKKAKQAGREQAAAEAIEAKSKLNAGRAESEARKARKEAIAAAVAGAAVTALPAMLAEAKQDAEVYLKNIYPYSNNAGAAEKKYKEAAAGSAEEAIAAANLFSIYVEKTLNKYKQAEAAAKAEAIAEAIAAK